MLDIWKYLEISGNGYLEVEDEDLDDVYDEEREIATVSLHVDEQEFHEYENTEPGDSAH